MRYVFILTLVFMGAICADLLASTYTPSHGNTISQVQTNKNHLDSEWDTVQITESLHKRFPNLGFDSSFRVLSKKDCLELKWMKEDRVEEFYEFTEFTEAFQLQFGNKYYLILLGQAAGATGIGADYREYECYEYGTQPEWYWDKTGITYHEDTVDEILLDDPAGGCPVLHRLDLKFHEEYFHEQNKVACNSFFWPINGETYTESQDYVEVTYHNEFGDKVCDSTYVLHLEINNYETNEVDYVGCDYMVWNNDTITESGPYERTFVNQQGCDSIVTMHVNLDYTPHPAEIRPLDPENVAPHWVVTATEFQINSYDFNLWDENPNCYWDTVTWTCDEAPEWVLEPFGNKAKCCRVYVLNHVVDTIWLKAHAFNLSSFYGVEENEAVCELCNFDVVPNPNNGQMTLNFEHLTGTVDVRVYDMRGTLIDQFKTYNGNGPSQHTYNMRTKSDGIYFFVATGREGTVAKKVVIQK